MPGPRAGCSFCRYLGFAICALVFGVPGVLFLGVLTWGVIYVPLAGLVMTVPFIFVNYVLWGRRALRELPAEGE